MSSLEDYLKNHFSDLNFIEVIRLLQNIAKKNKFTNDKPIGYNYAFNELVKLKTNTNLYYSDSEIEFIDDTKKNQPLVTVNFMGLFGQNGALPWHYTLLLQKLHRENKPELESFLDIFNHRALSYFYRASSKYQLPLIYENSERYHSLNTFTRILKSLVGLGTPYIDKFPDLPVDTILYYAAYYANQPRSAIGLKSILQHYFQLKVLIKQWQGKWVKINALDVTSLGKSLTKPVAYNQLGINAILGNYIFQVQNSFTICLGPLTYEQFQNFTPIGHQLTQLIQLAKFYCGIEFVFNLQFVVEYPTVPCLQLTVSKPNTMRLGWNTWLKNPKSIAAGNKSIDVAWVK